MILYTLLSVSLAAVCDNMLLLRYSFFFLLLILSMNVQVFVFFIRDFISRSLRHRHCFIVCVFFVFGMLALCAATEQTLYDMYVLRFNVRARRLSLSCEGKHATLQILNTK